MNGLQRNRCQHWRLVWAQWSWTWKAVDLIFCFCLPMFNGTGAGAEQAMLTFSRVGFSHMTWRRWEKAEEWTEAGLRGRWGPGGVRGWDGAVGSASDGRVCRGWRMRGMKGWALRLEIVEGFYSWADKSQDWGERKAHNRKAGVWEGLFMWIRNLHLGPEAWSLVF